MKKFYVRSGELEKIVLADNPRDACDRAIDLCHGETINPHCFSVDERGFRGERYVNGCFVADADMLEPEWTVKTDDVIATFGSDEGEEEQKAVAREVVCELLFENHTDAFHRPASLKYFM